MIAKSNLRLLTKNIEYQDPRMQLIKPWNIRCQMRDA